MKSLYESILDDEGILIDDVKKSANWENVIYNILVRNASSSNRRAMQEVCIEWLNEHVKFSNNPNVKWYEESPIWQGHTRTTYGNTTSNWVSLMTFDADPGHNDLYVYFPDIRHMRTKYKEEFIKGLREEFNMTEKDYINFKQDIIDKFKLKPYKHFTGDVWKSELK